MQGITLTFVFLLVLVYFTRIGSGQVTFSRDWNAGKRSASGEGNCLPNTRTTAAACHMLMNELKQLAACETRAMVQFLRTQDDVTFDQTVLSSGR